LDYRKDAPRIWLVTDGCNSGIAGVICQGSDWKKAKVAAFFSAKLNSAQQNYPVHEIEMLAGVESMLRHRDILQGCQFTWVTDHKGLTHLVNQKNLSGRQARWVEKISGFDFDIKYVPGTENVLADAFSRIYSNEAPGTVRARSEYTYHDVVDNDTIEISSITMPVFAGREAAALTSDRVTRSMARKAQEAAKAPEITRESENVVFELPVNPKEGGSTHKNSTSAQTTQKVPEPEAENNPEELEPEMVEELEQMDESLLQVVNSGWKGLDIGKFLANQYNEDKFFTALCGT
jgi:hypothetical protein